MIYKSFFLALLAVVLLTTTSIAQELKCRVNVNYSKVQGTSREVYNSMQQDINEFMNNHKWTEHVFGGIERIDCTIMITINEQIGSEKFKATVQVQSSRPVYNSSYSTTLLNYKERESDFQFQYVEGQSLDFNVNEFNSSLTSLLGFYAYIIIGLDYDTFAPNGGAPYFDKAMQIVNNAKSASAAGPGWQPLDSQRNRYWLAENLTSSAYSSIHKFLYSYHRTGLDAMSSNVENGRAEVANSLKNVQDVYIKKSTAPIIDVFLMSKSDEVVNIFKSGTSTEKKMVHTIMTKLDKSDVKKYAALLESDR